MHGVLSGSSTLVLDGDALSKKTTEIFTATVQRDVAFQAALNICYDRGILARPSWLERRMVTGYVYEVPQAIRKMQAGEYSSIQCNSDLGVPYDLKKLVEEGS